MRRGRVGTMVDSAESLAHERDTHVRPVFGVLPLWLAAALAVVVAAGVIYLVCRTRPSPAARERHRRLAVGAKGRMAGGTILDLQGDELLYSYTVRGVEYTAAQDVSALRDQLPEDVTAFIGPATVRYQPGNPANSIVISEEWSGLRGRRTSPTA